ncbi:MAG: hypothetical protein HC887_09170 [Desulfobacteraceae bacterium]|nr:hypothetical protein [Desulfobacteraceae bacterium]
MQNFAEEALLKEVMAQGWLNKLNQKQFKKARMILAKLSQEIPDVPKQQPH